jgi:DNA polymerase
MELHIDFETASEVEIGNKNGVGLYNYATHPTTRILMLAWAVNEEEPQLWEPHKEALPERLHKLLLDTNVTIIAFNSAFERYILKHQLNIEIPTERFQDPQASARYLSLPANLEDVGMVLGLPKELRKDKRGEQLLDLFSFPQKRKKKEGGGIYFNDWNTHPAEWVSLGEYAKQDVRAEREIARRERLLGVYPLPQRERDIWLFDQKVNDRGIPMDVLFVSNAFEIASRDKQEKLQQQNDMTGLENANSQQQLLPWVQNLGYPLNNLRKQNIELVLKNKEVDMHEDARKVLKARMIAGSTSYKKLQSMLRNVSPNGRLCNQFIYMGSSRCGRWSGNAVQLHNMARPDGTFEDMNNVVKARVLIYQNNFDELKQAFVNEKEKTVYAPLTIVKNLIRTVFVAPNGKRFNVCDLNAIETRVAAWVAGCKALLEVFEKGRDPYLDFANKIYGIPYEKLDADYHSKDQKIKTEAKRQRQIAKPGVLGAVYRLGAGGWGKDKNGDTIKTGLWGYAEGMNVDMTQEQAQQVVKIFREAYPEIGGVPNHGTGFPGGIWYVLENAVKDVLEGQKVIRKVGPEGCIVIDKITISDRDPMLRIKLPSGRYLHYMDASIQNVRMPWKQTKDVAVEFNDTGEATAWQTKEVDVYKPGFTYYGKDQHTDQWTMIVSHGGKIFENIVQAIARDVLADKLLEFEKIGLETVGHVHDEGICLSDDDPFAPGVLEMSAIMNRSVSWAPTLLLGSDGFEDSFYHK